jgi:hypothetical protein
VLDRHRLNGSTAVQDNGIGNRITVAACNNSAVQRWTF